MFKSIYKKIKTDFNYLEKYGYLFSHNVTHYIVPSVVFQDGKSSIRIGFNYESNRIYIQWFPSKGQLQGEQLFDLIDLHGASYQEQVNIAKDFLQTFLNSYKNAEQSSKN